MLSQSVANARSCRLSSTAPTGPAPVPDSQRGFAPGGGKGVLLVTDEQWRHMAERTSPDRSCPFSSKSSGARAAAVSAASLTRGCCISSFA